MLLTRRRFLEASAISAAVAGPAAALAMQPALHAAHHRTPWTGPRSLRVVQITDVHVGPTTSDEVLERAAALAHQARPDLVALTGDYLNRSLRPLPRLAEFVRSLPGPIVATLGNHDYWSGGPAVRRCLEDAGARVLVNESLSLDTTGGRITIAAVDDATTEHDDVDRAFADVRETALVLTHNPVIAPRIARQPHAGVILTGHTHGGQLHVPRLTDAVFVRATGHRFMSGWHALDHAQLYVSPGLGHTHLRYGPAARPEVAVIDLVGTR